MNQVPLEVVAHHIVPHLDPRDLARLSATARRYRIFAERVHPDYHVALDRALRRACLDGHCRLAQWLVRKGALLAFDEPYFLPEKLAKWICQGGNCELAKWFLTLDLSVAPSPWLMYWNAEHWELEEIVVWLNDSGMLNAP